MLRTCSAPARRLLRGFDAGGSPLAITPAATPGGDERARRPPRGFPTDGGAGGRLVGGAFARGLSSSPSEILQELGKGALSSSSSRRRSSGVAARSPILAPGPKDGPGDGRILQQRGQGAAPFRRKVSVYSRRRRLRPAWVRPGRARGAGWERRFEKEKERDAGRPAPSAPCD